MTRAARPARKPKQPASAPTPADERRIEALTVAMTLAPGVYSRNRMFALFADVNVQRAKARAATLRGIVQQLPRACAVTLTQEDPVHRTSGELEHVLRYQVPELCMSRVVELSAIELATLRLLGARAGVHCLPAADGDRALVDGTLARLLLDGGDATDIARAAAGSVPPPAALE